MLHGKRSHALDGIAQALRGLVGQGYHQVAGDIPEACGGCVQHSLLRPFGSVDSPQHTELLVPHGLDSHRQAVHADTAELRQLLRRKSAGICLNSYFGSPVKCEAAVYFLYYALKLSRCQQRGSTSPEIDRIHGLSLVAVMADISQHRLCVALCPLPCPAH